MLAKANYKGFIEIYETELELSSGNGEIRPKWAMF